LNNAVNHGIFTPLGLEQASHDGNSIFFMIESNPGPGIGLLLAYMLVGKGLAKASAPGAAIIQFFGGIHEIYFPYVLMNPVVIIATIAGNVSGIFTLQLLHGGLVAAASPGSIFAEMAMTPRGGFVANILGIAVAAAVSFVLSVVLLRLFDKGDGDLGAAQEQVSDMKAESKGLGGTVAGTVAGAANVALDGVRKIVFACDAGMGSSAMGATMLRKKLKAAGLDDIEVIHAAVSEIPSDAQVVVTHQELQGRAAGSNPNAKIVAITNFMAAPEYDVFAKELADSRKEKANA
jgi:PTS system mannitol-specific IIC component